MTAAVETQPEANPEPSPSAFSTGVVRIPALFSLLFLLVGAAGLLIAYSGIAWPDTWSGDTVGEYLSYGRAFPAAMTALVFGWLTLGLVAVTHHFVPRLLGIEMAFPVVARANAVLMAGGVGSAVAAIVLGEGTGGRVLEIPWYSDLALVVSFLVFAASVSATITRSNRERVGVAVWYFTAAAWWLFLSYAVAAIPGLDGAPAEMQSSFTMTAVFGMWVAPAAVGAGYALFASVMPDAAFHPRLGRIGFWSLGLSWAWTTARTLQYGPMANWIETIPVLFSAVLVVAALTIAADFAWALRGRWDDVARSVPLQLHVTGTALFVVVPVHMLLQSFRSSSAVIRFTGWEAAFDLFVVLGVFTFWVGGTLAHVLADLSGRSWSRRLGVSVGVPLGVGVLFAVGTRWVAGLQQGYTWLAGAETDSYANFGDGYFNTVAPLHGTDVLTAIGLFVAAAGLLVLIAGLSIRAVAAGSGNRSSLEGYAWPDDERPSSIRRGAAAIFALAVFVGFVSPAIDSNDDPTMLADGSRNLAEGSLEARGRDIYVAEGCWYCHTQQVRAVVTDLGLGPVSVAGDYSYDPAGILGVARIGPDLMHAGSRQPTEDPAWIESHLADPRAERPWSTMPSYAHLSESELSALAAYVAGLE